MSDENAAVAAATEQVQNLHLDDVTGEMISKTERMDAPPRVACPY